MVSSGITAQTLHEALSANDTVAAVKLINAGSDINAVDNNGTTALMTSCRWADEPMVRFLLAHGATPDKPRTAKGRTALMITCAYYGGKGLCSLLIDKGADVNAVANDGTTALMLAAMNAKLDVVELLLKHGAKATARDASGKSVMDYAAGAKVDDYLQKSVKDTRLDKDAVIRVLTAAQK
jgi:ankyrin repeat protein